MLTICLAQLMANACAAYGKCLRSLWRMLAQLMAYACAAYAFVLRMTKSSLKYDQTTNYV